MEEREMNRRLSLTAALFLTTVSGFVVTTYGANNGMFGSGAAEGEPPLVQATGTSAPVPTAPPPQVIEQIVYRDEYVVAPAPSGSTPASGSAPVPAVEAAHQGSDGISAGVTQSKEHEGDDEHGEGAHDEEEHDDVEEHDDGD
jgi:hypothetical protein